MSRRPAYRVLRALVATGALGLAAACGSDELTGPTLESQLVGAWELETVNGQPLPFLGSNDQFCDLRIYSSMIGLSMFRLNSRMRDHSQYIRRSGFCSELEVREYHEITWGVTGDSITITLLLPLSSRSYRARLVGDRLEISYRSAFRFPDGEYRYRKIGDDPII